MKWYFGETKHFQQRVGANSNNCQTHNRNRLKMNKKTRMVN